MRQFSIKRGRMSKKSQAALEFLTTYAWAFIVISIAVGALYSFGILDFGKYLPQKCVFPSQFKCLDFSLDASQVRIKLVNNLGENIKVTEVKISNDENTLACTPTSVPFDWAHSKDIDIAFSSCSGGGYISGSRIELKISFEYYAVNTPSKPVHAVSGKINGRILSS